MRIDFLINRMVFEPNQKFFMRPTDTGFKFFRKNFLAEQTQSKLFYIYIYIYYFGNIFLLQANVIDRDRIEFWCGLIDNDQIL
jgi:hypothetical protein